MTTAAAYLGPHLYQGSTTPCPWQNCNPTSHSVMTDIDWLGAKRGTITMVGSVRNWIDSHYGIGCVGTSNVQCDSAVLSIYGTALTHKWDIAPSTVRSGLLGGYKVCGIESYAIWHGTPWDYSPTFSGGHAVVYKAARDNTAISTPRWEWLRGDPMNKSGDQWVPESLALKALEAEFSDHNVEYSLSRCLAASAAKKVLYPHDTVTGGAVGIRAAAKVGSDLRGTLHAGQLLTQSGTVTGGIWTVNGKSGTHWLKVTAIDGHKTTALYGATVTAVYVASGWLAGPTGAY